MRPILLLLAGATLVAASPVVKVSLRTSWPAPPLLLEIMYGSHQNILEVMLTCAHSETIGLINNDAYFPALDALTGPARLAIPSPTSDEALYEWAIATAVEAGFVKESSSLDAYLALHAAVPKIEAFYQQKGSLNGLEGSEDCRSWVEWYGDIICDVDTLSHRIGRATIDANNETHHTR
jgi:UDP-glucose:glycoprotein glucosyltransferase